LNRKNNSYRKATKGDLMIYQTLVLEENNGIYTVTLNRPEKHNAISFLMLRELISAAKHIKKNRSARVVIITGDGPSFSAGIDLNDLRNPKNRLMGAWELVRPGQNFFQKAFLIWKDLPIPVITVIHGNCFGAGMQLALATDMRVCTPDATLSIMEGHWGLIPDMGLTRSLRGLVATDVAKYLTMSARKISAQEALDYRLLTAVTENPLALAQQWADELILRSPDSVLGAKRLIDSMAHRPGYSLQQEKIWQLKLLLGKNMPLAQKKNKDPNVEYHPRQYR
jgi:enoyl-CoA hydratase/carnithine racemase